MCPQSPAIILPCALTSSFLPHKSQQKPTHSLSLSLSPSTTMPLLFLLLSLLLLSSASANKYNVGDEKGWNPGVNYTLWVNKHRPFHLGDWLVFYYQSGMADVVQVDETAYNKCDASHPISNYSKGRSYAFELNQTKRYYFICSFGYCYQGMKVSVLAHPLPPPSPPPSADRSAGCRTQIRHSAILGFALPLILPLLF